MNQYGLCYVKCDETAIIGDRIKCQIVDSDIYQIINSATNIIIKYVITKNLNLKQLILNIILIDN